MRIFLLILLFIASISMQPQAPNYTFAHGLGNLNQDQATSVACDASGNVYVTGNFSDAVDFDLSAATNSLIAKGFADIFIAKYSSNGVHQWAFGFGGSGGYDSGQGIATDAAGNVYVTGYFTDTVDFDPGVSTATRIALPGDVDAFLVKYNSSGQFQWVHQFQGPGLEQGLSVATNPVNNDVIVTGKFEMTTDFDGSASVFPLTSNGSMDFFIARYSSSGNFVSAFSIGSTGGDVANDVSVDALGNVYVTGALELSADFDPSPTTSLVIPAVGSSGTDIFVAKYNNTDVLQFAFCVGDVNNDNAYSIINDASNNVYVTGYYNSLADFDPSPATATVLSNSSSNDIFIAKYTSAGTYQWIKTFGGSGNEHGSALSIDGAGGLFITGGFENTIDFDPSPSTMNLSSNGLSDVFVAKYNSTGGMVWAFQSGGTGSDIGFGIANNTTGTTIFCAGLLQNTVDFDPSASNANVSCVGVEDGFLAGYLDPTVGISEKDLSSDVTVYPNPASDKVSIKTNQTSKVIITDVMGKEFLSRTISAGENELSLTSLPSGIYFITMITENSRKTVKLMKD